MDGNRLFGLNRNGIERDQRVTRVTGGETIDETLIAHLYDGALHDGNWLPALERVVELLGATEASLTYHGLCDAAEPDNAAYSTGRIIDASAVARYMSHFINVDPKRSILTNRKVGFVFNDADHFSDDFVGRDPFYQEFSRSINSRHTLDMLINRSSSQEIFFASMRTARQGHYDGKTVATFLQASRHFSNVARLRASIVTAERSIENAMMGLDALAFGLIVLDKNKRAITVNSGALRACSGEQGLSLISGHLSAHSNSINEALNRAIDLSLVNPVGTGTTLRVPRPSGPAWVISVVPLPASSALAVRGVPGALVLIGDGKMGPGVHRESLMAIYGLTIAEADLAILLGHGGSLAEAAQRRGVKVSTARSQLHSILQKMQIQRQADLIRVLATLPANLAAR